MDRDALRNEAATATGESSHIEFKTRLDAKQRRDWCEIIKDVLAIHNSGGGVVIFGLNDDGTDAGPDGGIQGRFDAAHVIDKVQKYTQYTLVDLESIAVKRFGRSYAAWVIPAAREPIPFTLAGEWQDDKGKTRFVFHRGQIYFRHGPKSEPAVHSDFVRWREDTRAEARTELYRDMGRIVDLPPGHRIDVVREVRRPGAGVEATPVRLVDDAEADACRVVDKFETHPHRQKELIERLATRLPQAAPNAHDVLCIRRMFADELERQDFIYRPRFGSPQYAEELVDWIAEQIRGDADFLSKTRAQYKAAFPPKRSSKLRQHRANV